MLKKIKNFFGEKFSKKNKNFKKKLQLWLIIFVFLFWIFSIKFDEIQDFSAKIFLESFSEEKNIEEKIFLNLWEFLEKIKSWDEKKIQDLEYIYWKNFENFSEILDERVVQNWDKIKFYFEATVWKWGSIHEFNYEWKISEEWKILEIF